MLVNGARGNLISIRDRGLLYGDGVFRTFTAIGGHASHWPLHYLKLKHDCAALRIACPEVALLTTELRELLASHPDGVFKLMVTRGIGQRGYTPPTSSQTTHLWDISSLPADLPEWAIHGVKVRVCDLRLSTQPQLAGIKHLNRLENVLAAGESTDADIAEGLLCDAAGNMIGGVRSNLFLVIRGVLVTPDLARCGVAGVQRDRVMAWAKARGFAVQVRDITLDECSNADEVFLTNSVFGLWPIRELGENSWHQFPLASQIRLDLQGDQS
jgi:4-amino-4-deoxychorismate lyase